MEFIRDLSFVLLLNLVGTIVDPRGTLVVSGSIGGYFVLIYVLFIILLLLLRQRGVTIFYFEDCKTNGGARPNLPCLFPFNYKGTKYTECTKMENKNVPWCSTKVDSKRNYVNGNWGNCSPGCSGVSAGRYSQKYCIMYRAFMITKIDFM